MTGKGALACFALTGAAFALQGCVVAAAAPLAAAGVAIAKGKRETPRTPGLTVPNQVASVSTRSATMPANMRPSAVPDLSEQRTVVATDLTALPAPTLRDLGISDATFRSFADHALARAEPGLANDATRSAILSDPDDLDAAREPCGKRPAMVLIDLDPGREAFDPLAPGTTDPALVNALAQLRARDVVIAWQTRLGEGFAETIREVLARTGLDPAGTDRLEVLRSLDERKQTRRDALAKSHCIGAILGDDRADFDELYLYLKDPDAAVPLDAMIGRGWFLASPIASGA